jgi:hypothetical protein
VSGRYAEKTTVAAEQSRSEIERILTRYGADSFMYGWTDEGAVVAFRARGRHVKFVVGMPDRNDPAFTSYKRGQYGAVQQRTADAAEKLWEQATRQRWRALALVIKAKLEAVAAGISTFEAEFLANTMLPDGRTVDEWIQPQMSEAYASGAMPATIQFALPRGSSDA